MGIEEFLLQRTKREEFERGVEKGLEKVKETERTKNFQFIKVLLTQTDHDIEKIADMVGVPVSFVQMVKDSLG